MNLLFVDPKSWTPYDGASLRVQAEGGTQTSLVTIAEGLAATHRVVVEQYGRSAAFEPSPTLRYLPMHAPRPFGDEAADVVVILRRIRFASAYRRRFPKARLYVWIHNWQRPEVMLKRVVLARSGCALIAVSDVLALASDRQVNGLPARLLGDLADREITRWQ